MTQSGKQDNLISARDAEMLIRAHDGDVALLCIHALKNGGIDCEKAARDLCRTLGEMRAAEEKLLRLGILGEGTQTVPPAEEPAKILPPADELPEYRADDIVLRTREDAEFSAVVQEAQKVLGHALSTPDLKRLFGIYDYLALPAEVILVLLNHCVNISRGRRPSMRFIEKEAFSWVNREILTLERAEEYIRNRKLRDERFAQLRAVLGLQDNELTPAVAKYINSWLDMGFDRAALEEAKERTVLNTGALKLSYLNKIMLNWHSAGLHSAAEIEAGDPRRKSAPPADSAGGGAAVDIDALKEALNKI